MKINNKGISRYINKTEYNIVCGIPKDILIIMKPYREYLHNYSSRYNNNIFNDYIVSIMNMSIREELIQNLSKSKYLIHLIRI